MARRTRWQRFIDWLVAIPAPDPLAAHVAAQESDAADNLYTNIHVTLTQHPPNPHTWVAARELSELLAKGYKELQNAEPPNSASAFALTDADHVDHLAARVHAAWMAEKQRQGFADHPYDYRLHDGPRRCDKPHDLHHKDMVPFNGLSEATKDYDRATVRAVLAALIEEDNHGTL